MKGEVETALRQMLKSVIREVFNEVLEERQFHSHSHPDRPTPDADPRFLLRAREAAKRLAISERHLFKFTSEGTIPCVRIGRLVHYSVETIEQWIRETESTEAPVKPTGRTSKRNTTTKVPPATPNVNTKQKKASRTKSSPQPKTKEAGATKSRKRLVEQAEANQEPERINPFTELLKEMGIDRDKVGPMSNGELMRIAQVELPVYHGWMYLGRELPEEALEKLRQHFRKVLTGQDIL